jgi:hypothetical protein
MFKSVVPDIGGPTEFVPRKYQYRTLEQAAEIISSAFHLPYAERVQISNSVNKFLNSQYIKGLQHMLNEMVSSHIRYIKTPDQKLTMTNPFCKKFMT